jgi:hypothetical protein
MTWLPEFLSCQQGSKQFGSFRLISEWPAVAFSNWDATKETNNCAEALARVDREAAIASVLIGNKTSCERFAGPLTKPGAIQRTIGL